VAFLEKLKNIKSLSALSSGKHYINGNMAQVGCILYSAPL